MRKNVKTSLILLLALLTVVSTVVLVACNKEPTSVTLTVDYGLTNVPNDTYTVDIGSSFSELLVQPSSEYTFVGWFMSDGSQVTNATVAPSSDFTVSARWNAVYRVEYWLEKADGSYELSDNWTVDSYGLLGSTISAEVVTINGYYFDATNPNNVQSAKLVANGTTLKLYYVRNILTLTFDKLISSASGSMASISDQFGATVTLPTCAFSSDFTFVGWNTARDGTGVKYADGAVVTLNGNMTLYAQWETTYTISSYKEVFVGDTFDTEYQLVSSVSNTGIIGHGVSVVLGNPDATKYVLDEEKSVIHGELTEQATTFTSYFKLITFAVRYTEDDMVEYVKYGANYTVRTPKNDDPNSHISCYCTATNGEGTDYEFGAVIENVTYNITLYPVIWDVYSDDGGSDDTIEIRRNMTGSGSAILVREGVRYNGEAIREDSGYLSFEVEVAGETLLGRPYTDGENNLLFHYRGEEMGVYFYYNYLTRSEDDGWVLILDGYGAGELWTYSDESSWGGYNVMYVYDDEWQEYWLLDYSYGEPVIIGYFTLVYEEIPDHDDVKGHFILGDIDGELDEHVWRYNQQNWSVFLNLDGYGNAIVYSIDESGEITESTTGSYYDSGYVINIRGVEYKEYVFESDDEKAFPTCTFILYRVLEGGDWINVFSIQDTEYGEYYSTESKNFPALYLDGYGNAQYFTDANAAGRAGTYTIEQLSEDTYRVVISFVYDVTGGELTVEIVITNDTGDMCIGTFTVVDD